MVQFLNTHWICSTIIIIWSLALIAGLIEVIIKNKKRKQTIKYLEWLIKDDSMTKDDRIAYYNRYKNNK